MISFGVEAFSHAAGFVYINVQLSPWLILFGVFFAFIVGSVSGILPAIRATRMQAVDALRYE